ncbi:hypothetical protein EZS27_042269, partial [termite gut metagenome]
QVEEPVDGSTQHITLTPGNTLYQMYSTEEKLEEAVRSYGIPGEARLLDPGNTRKEAEDTYFLVKQFTKNGTLVPKGSGSLSVNVGNVLEIKESKLTDTEIQANVLTNPTADISTIQLSDIGTVVGSDSLITITATRSLMMFYLLISRATASKIEYFFHVSKTQSRLVLFFFKLCLSFIFDRSCKANLRIVDKFSGALPVLALQASSLKVTS